MMADISEKAEMKWHNLNIGLKISVNSGAALFIFLGAFFAFLLLVAKFPAVEKNFIAGLGGLTVAFERYLNKRNNNNKLELESKKVECEATNGQ